VWDIDCTYGLSEEVVVKVKTGHSLLQSSKDGLVDAQWHFRHVLHLLTHHVYLTDLSPSIQLLASLVHKAVRQTIHSLTQTFPAFQVWQLKRTILTLTYMAMERES
jgi:hypothetical protein